PARAAVRARQRVVERGHRLAGPHHRDAPPAVAERSLLDRGEHAGAAQRRLADAGVAGDQDEALHLEALEDAARLRLAAEEDAAVLGLEGEQSAVRIRVRAGGG